MNDSGRPLSPHISIYRWPITMTLSILHRATGVAMSLGLIVMAIWLLSAATSADKYNEFLAILSSVPGQILLIGWSFSFFFHLMNGIRHLFWDTGRGFQKQQANASAWFVIVTAILLNAIFWLVLL
jgi:succinate dehydrogenase / fumarate reductase cytochrome b subunit